LLKIVNHDYPLTIPKHWSHHDTLSDYFFGGGEPECFHCILCFFILDPCFIVSYDSVDKIRFILVAWNNKPCPFLVVSQLFGDPSNGNLWHAIDISQNCLNWTKTYTTSLAMLHSLAFCRTWLDCAQLRQFDRWWPLLAAQAAHHLKCSTCPY
jgi:hypothetical protein